MINYKERCRESEFLINVENFLNDINLKDKLWSIIEAYQGKSKVIHKSGKMHTMGIAFSRLSEEGR